MTAIGLNQTVLTNARIVLSDRVVEGAVEMAGGVITEIGPASARGVDLEGDYLIPGLVELHTDHLETHYAPRPKVRWHPVAAVQAHDAQIAASGITTVFDAIRVGTDEHADMGAAELRILADAVTAGVEARRLRADHFIHLRCEVSAPDCLEAFEGIMDHPLVRLASLMDHAPGQRQFASSDAYRAYYQGKLKLSDAALAEFIARRSHESVTYADRHRQALAALSHARGIALASHDDATTDHVDKARDLGISIAEFPTTLEAAKASRDAGFAILMGGPNVVRGGSHSGNVSARDLAAAGLLDILSSDYIPFSMLQAAFCLVDAVDGLDVAQAISLVTRRPAEAAGLHDRGEIALAKRADFVQVRIEDGIPIVRTVWRQGRRVL
ncbi:alpha-D-ribose 1-methylphosphonate 5-triphosphate diphosphatase [Devosia sp.]|uniref:alpha-D-ribose 1-methylphosphonate 5-triphosphate diphosphatase n=1 Tax=Devosia sp. TaxID=1871048 RepID=UPI002736933B|nr:alpha-D-ribose 1-methylphosphonate 5-triphosphate diphosphatase [Devosia sp.]MDP2781980.1 alpha-D-ribose 1-methylphosphonate 5-triphosphate diphosphatase [Devosia sp.]